MLGLRRNEVIGVDIGSFSVKIVQLRKSGKRWVVTAAGIVDIAEKSSESAGRREANSLRAVINCLRLTGVKTKLAVCGVGGPEVAVRNFEFPALPAEETERAVLLEAKQVCPFETDDIAFDYRLTPANNGKTSGYLVVADNKLIRSRIRLAKKARLNCALIDVDGLALLNCFSEIEKTKSNHGAAILNIGNRYTTLAIEGGNDCPFIRYLNYGGDSIIKTIAAENDESSETVETTLSAEPEDVPANIRQSLENACERLINDIAKSVRYYGAQEQSSDIQKLFVCGGFALFEELMDILNSQLPMEVVLWNPFDKMRYHAGRNPRAVLLKSILRKNGPAMSVAAGLAMRSI
jgi:type IV pilus assembly protein PilM